MSKSNSEQVKYSDYFEMINPIQLSIEYYFPPNFGRFRPIIYIRLYLPKKLPSSNVYRIFEVKKWLNMNSKSDKESRSCGDIAFLSEIIANSIYWQAISSQEQHQF